MTTIPTTQGAILATDMAVGAGFPYTVTGTARTDLGTILTGIDARLADTIENFSCIMTGGGLVSFTGTTITFTEDIKVELLEKRGSTGTAVPVITTISYATYSGTAVANNDIVYSAIQRDSSASSALLVVAASTGIDAIRAGSYINNFVIAVRRDAADGTKILYLRNGQSITEGQSVRLGASGSGSGGSGELNYILNPSAATNINDGTPKTGFGGWNLVSDHLVLARDTTAANLPREKLTSTGISITATSGTQSVNDWVYYSFTLDDVDLNRVLKIQWDQKIIGTYSSGNLFTVAIIDQSGAYTVIATPTVSTVPASDGTFAATFISNTAAIRLAIRAGGDMDTGAGICISNVIVGPGQLVQGAPVSDELGLTFTSTNFGNGTISCKSYRIGKLLQIHGIMTVGSSLPTGSILVNLPSGLTIPSAQWGTGEEVGSCNTLVSGGANTGVVQINSSGQLSFFGDDGSGIWNATNPITFANTNIISFSAIIPVDEWSTGVYLGSGADTSVTPLNWTSFTPNFSNLGGSPTLTGRYRRVGDSVEGNVKVVLGAVHGGIVSLNLVASGLPAIDTTKLPTDSGSLGTAWFYDATGPGGVYSHIGVVQDSGGNLRVLSHNNAGGTYWDADCPITGALSDVMVLHFTYPASGWTTQDYIGKMLVGFASASATAPGLVNNDTQTFSGSKTFNNTATGTVISKFATGTQAASTTEQGIVTTADQTFGGMKRFNDGIAGSTIGLSAGSTYTSQSAACLSMTCTGAGTVTLNSFAGGVSGQILYLAVLSSATTLVIKHVATGTQPIYCSTSADITISGYGGATLRCDGSGWVVIGYAA